MTRTGRRTGLGKPRRRALAAAAALACLVLTGLALPVSGWPAGSAAAATAATGVVRIVITGLSPVSPTSKSTLVVSGQLANQTATRLTDLSGALMIGQQLSGLSDLATQEQVATTEVTPVPAAKVSMPAAMAPHGHAHFRVKVALAQVLPGSAFGVYPLQLHYVDSATGALVGQADTFLPFSGYQPASRLRVVTLWPLQTEPGLAGDDATLAGSSVLRQVSGGGRLAGLLAAGASSPLTSNVTWVVDPQLLQTVSDLTRPYSVLGASGTFPPSHEAARFLTRLASAAATGDLLALPYADPDLTALVRAGLGVDIEQARSLGAHLVKSLLHLTPQTNAVWPVAGRLDHATLAQLVRDKVRTVLLSDQQLPTLASATPSTTSAPATVVTSAGPVQALAMDTGLANLVAAGGRDAPSPRLAEQLVLAYTALVVGQQPGVSGTRDMVVSPPRNWSPEPAFAADLLSGLAQASWVQPITLRQAQRDPDGAHGALLGYPSWAQAAELSQAALTGPGPSVFRLEQAVGSVADMFGTSTPTAPQRQALLAAESAEWRSDPAGGLALRNQVRVDVTNTLAGVRVAAAPQVTLTSRTATLPVTIGNGLHHQVSVLLRIVDTNPAKLTTGPPVLRKVAPGEKLLVRLPVQTQRSGTFTIQLRITTPDGRALGPAGAPLTVTVHSRNYGVITIVITVGALAVLVVSLLVRLTRRVHRARTSRARAPVPSR